MRISAGTLIKWRIFIGAKLNPSRNGYFLSPGRVQWPPFFISYFCSLRSKRTCSKKELPNDFPQTGRAKVGAIDWGKACKKTPYFWKTRSSTNGGFWLVRQSHNDWQVTHFRAKYYLLVLTWQRQLRKMLKVLNRVLNRESGLGFTLKREQELSMRHLFSCIGVMAVLTTGFGKIFRRRWTVSTPPRNALIRRIGTTTLYHILAILCYKMKHGLLLNKMQSLLWYNMSPWQLGSPVKTPFILSLVAYISKTNSVTPIFFISEK